MQEFFVLHPFWAFTTKPGVTVRQRLTPLHISRLHAPQPDPHLAEWQDVTANNHGFPSRHDYPYEPGDGSFIVGVFGSSIAQFFSLQAGARLAKDLCNRVTANRRVEVLNFGVGGLKQPQSLFIFLYFLLLGQRFDAIVLLDGFSEAALSWINHERGILVSQPSAYHMDMFAETPGLHSAPAADSLTHSERVTQIASLWEDSANVMRQVCKERSIPFFLFLHPNQYYSRKTLTAEESDFAVHERSPYKNGVEAVYPELVRRVHELHGRGWAAFDATTIFDDISETVYADNCCHYNDLGNAILERFMVDNIVNHWELAKR